MTSEKQIEESLLKKLKDLKYTYRQDIRDKAALEANFQEHFQRLVESVTHNDPCRQSK
jgi:type I restriction enzyme, R subunit